MSTRARHGVTRDEWAAAVDQAVRESVTAMASADDRDWSRPAGDLVWDCRATALHIASDLVAYAGQLTAPRDHGYVPFDIILEGAPGPAGIREVVRSTGGLLSSVVRTADPGTVSWHPYGPAGPCDFAAMGIVEVLVHTEDLSRGLGFSWTPSESLARSVLEHLFPEVAVGGAPWPDLLRATGRSSDTAVCMPGDWRWVNKGT